MSPLEKPIDIVITWVNYADPNYIQTILGHPPTCRGAFDELKYLLRSLEKFRFLNNVNHVYIVHSDLHGPPEYLRTDHPQLTFIRHSQLVPDQKYMPLITYNSIVTHLHRIPGLQQWFLYSADDILALQPWEVFVQFFNEKQLAVYSTLTELTRSYCETAPSRFWMKGCFNSTQLLTERFGAHSRYLDTHTPHMMCRDTIKTLESLWPDEFERTRRGTYDDEDHISLEVLHDEYLIDTGRAIRRFAGRDEISGIYIGNEIHTNDGSLNPPTNLSKIKHLLSLLDIRSKDSLFLNIQGPGISSEYNYEPAYDKIITAWRRKLFPDKSTFER